MQKLPGAVIIEGHVQGLANTRALGEAGIPVVVVDRDTCVASKSKYCKAFYKSPGFLDDTFVDFLINLAENEGLMGWVLLPSNDHAVITLSKNRKRLSKFFKVITPDEKIIQNIYNKQRLLEIAGSLGVPVPKTVYPQHPDTDFGTLRLPVIIKGKQGLTFYKTFGKKVFVANTYEELKIILQDIETDYDLNKVFVQELIPLTRKNKTVSFTAFVNQGEIKTHWTGVKLREHPVKFGTATYCESIVNESCYQYSVPLLKALNYTGVCEVEYLLDPRDNEYKLIEINARTWLWVGLAKSCGVNYPLMIYNFLTGKPQDYPQSYRVGVKWMHILTDVVFSFIGIIKGQYLLTDYIKSVFTKKTFAIFSLNDIKPFGFFLFTIVKILKNR